MVCSGLTCHNGKKPSRAEYYFAVVMISLYNIVEILASEMTHHTKLVSSNIAIFLKLYFYICQSDTLSFAK